MNKQTLFLISILLVLSLVFVFWTRRTDLPVPPMQETPSAIVPQPIDITEAVLSEQYFTGKRPVITGTGVLADTARAAVEKQIADFALVAEKEVPDRIKEFGKDSPAASYTIDIGATLIMGVRTQSIVLDSYVYRGGANGSSLYTVFTASIDTGKILSLGDLIASEKREGFVAMVRKELLASPSGGIFPESVQALTFDTLDDWSLDTQGNLTVYFDKYEIGAGALGAVAFPLSKEKIAPFIRPDSMSL